MRIRIAKTRMNIKHLRKLLDEMTDHSDDENNFIYISSDDFEEIDYEKVHNDLRDYIIKLKEVSKNGEKLRKIIPIR